MNPWTYVLLLPALAAMTASCVSDDDSMDAGRLAEKGRTGVSITLSLDGSAVPGHARETAARTPADGEYSPGEGFENYIQFTGDSPDVRVYIVDAGTDTVMREFEKPAAVPLGDSGNPKYYRLNMTVPSEEVETFFGSGKVKLMMLANWRDYPEAAVGKTVGALAEDAAAACMYRPFGGTLTAEDRIPMFGIRRYEGFTIDKGTYNELGTLRLLRALAKVEVTDNVLPGVARITKVELVRYNNLAAKAPYGVTDESQYVSGTWFLDYGDISIPSDAQVCTGPAEFMRADGGHSFVMYCPEFDNTSADAAPSTIRVTYDDGEVYDLEFKNYGDIPGMEKDGRFDIKRNNWYRYTLTRKLTSVNVELDVQPYASVEVTAPLGLARDDMGDLMVYMEKDDDGNLGIPEAFQVYLEKNKKSLPVDGNGALLSYEDEIGDYYAIHLGTDGTMENSEVWLKDNSGGKVISNFVYKDDNSEECSTRKVIDYRGSSEIVKNKDRDGEERLQHNKNHTTIVYDKDGVMIFKNTENTERYEVESWDSDTGLFYIISESGTKFVFIEYDNSGEPTGKVVEIDKAATESIR